MRPGMEFKGDYFFLLVSGLDADAGQIPVYRIKEVRMAHPISFPLQKLENLPSSSWRLPSGTLAAETWQPSQTTARSPERS